MATIISTKTSGVGGLSVTGDGSGVLQLASADGTTAVTIDASQNVGIGTSSPSGKLEVVSSADRIFKVTGGTDTPAQISSTVANCYMQISGSVADLYLGNVSGAATITTGGSERMRIDSSGNVKLSTAGTTIQNSSGRAILNQTGSVLQVVNFNYGTATSSSSSTLVSSGLTASITPSSTSSKILVTVNMGSIQNNNNGNGINFQLWRNATALYNFAIVNGYTNAGIVTVSAGGGSQYLDAPVTTSATSYTVYFGPNTNGQTVTVHANGAASSIVLMEIAG